MIHAPVVQIRVLSTARAAASLMSVFDFYAYARIFIQFFLERDQMAANIPKKIVVFGGNGFLGTFLPLAQTHLNSFWKILK